MMTVRFRPDIRIPWPALAGFAVAIYVLRSALRGWDFVPDLTDAIVFGGLAAILAARPFVARWMRGDTDQDD